VLNSRIAGAPKLTSCGGASARRKTAARRRDERDRAKFQKAQSYMVLMDDKVACKNLRCRRRFDVSGIKSMAFL